MNYDEIVNLNDNEVLQLYDDDVEMLGWECKCKTVYQNSSCRCTNSSNSSSGYCGNLMSYNWDYNYENRYLDYMCKDWCRQDCYSSNCYNSVYTGYSSVGDGFIRYCRRR